MIREKEIKEVFKIRPQIWICLILVLLPAFVYGPVKRFEYVAFDDNIYVYENREVRTGLTPESIAWAFAFKNHQKSTYWHPLTWLSHMLDVELYGMNPGAHHLTNLLFHVMSTLLLFVFFSQITGMLWQSAFVAALFALHPVNVESVAWVAERKNVLSTFLWMLTLLAYAWYVRRPALSKYLLMLLVFVLGLMAKPMLVTLPFAMLLLDYWPLGRFQFKQMLPADNNDTGKACMAGGPGPGAFRLLLEKLPLFTLSGISSFLSTLSLHSVQTIKTLETVPLTLRIANALVSYVKYALRMVWPRNLGVLYPYPDRVPAWQVIAAIVLLTGLSVWVVRNMRSRPYLLVGWGWFLGTLVPVLGLVQAGLWPEMADRWAYLPQIGLFVIAAWGGAEILATWRHRKAILAVSAAAILSAMTVMTSIQIRYWQDSIHLFEQALRITDKSPVLYNNLGESLRKKGRIPEAIRHFNEALRLNPAYTEAHNNLGIALALQGKYPEATAHYDAAIRINPAYKEAYLNLGILYGTQGKLTEAINCYLKALQIDPEFAEAHNNIGGALAMQGRGSEAISHFQAAVRIRPDYRGARENLQKVLSAPGDK